MPTPQAEFQRLVSIALKYTRAHADLCGTTNVIREDLEFVRRMDALPKPLTLNLPFEHEILCKSRVHDQVRGDHIVMVQKLGCDSREPFVVYRADRNGDCHGGSYCATEERAEQIFQARVMGREPPAEGEVR